MARNRWLDVNGTYTNTANWSEGTLPAATEDVDLDGGTNNIVSCPTTGLDYNSVNVYRDFAGKIAAAGNPWELGSLTVRLLYNGASCRGAYFACDATETVPLALVKASMAGGEGLNFVDTAAADGGTWTEIAILGGNAITIATGVNVTRLNVAGGVTTLDSGANITAAQAMAGVVHCSAAFDDGSDEIRVGGSATWNHIGSSTFDVDNVVVLPGGTFNWHDYGSTIDNLWVFPTGTVNANGGPGRARTATNVWNYGVINLTGLGSNVTLTNMKADSGKVER
jgi:hypothetical protein